MGVSGNLELGNNHHGGANIQEIPSEYGILLFLADATMRQRLTELLVGLYGLAVDSRDVMEPD